MSEINQEKFGAFLQALRKEKNMTQRQVGDKLFVSDKTVSKWERGESIPNVSLLLPIAAFFDVSVDELLKGERSYSVEPVTETQMRAAVEKRVKTYRKKWQLLFAVSALLAAIGTVLLWKGAPRSFEGTSMLTAMMLIFGAWLCFFAKEALPIYYDNHRIGFVTQGIFRINLVGLAINNGNWPQLLAVLRGYSLAVPAFGPYASFLLERQNHLEWQEPLVWLVLGAMILMLYGVGKRYE